ncbi:MAG: XdhC family protein [Bauldia sp.]
MDSQLLNRLNQARAARVAAIVLTDTTAGTNRLLTEGEDLSALAEGPELADRFRTGRSGLLGDGRTLATVHIPPPRLIMIGAVHISQALAPMAAIAGLDPVIIDPRTAFATTERFPSVTIFAEWPDIALPRIGVDRHCALAALTHDPKIDDGPIAAALAARCFYVGALGSSKTHAKRLDRLRAKGFGETELARIHAPIGIDIEAQSPAEIAVAVLAEIIQARHSPAASNLESAA